MFGYIVLNKPEIKFKDYDIIKVVAKISVGEESQELVAIVER